MQANKIKIGNIYAVDKGALKRFVVHEVITRRISQTKSESEARGRYLDAGNGHPPNYETTLPVSELLGPFEDYAELVAKKKAEKLAADEKAAQENADRIEVANLLYDLVGVKRTLPYNDYRAPFESNYSGVAINKEGIRLLLNNAKFIKTLARHNKEPTA